MRKTNVRKEKNADGLPAFSGKIISDRQKIGRTIASNTEAGLPATISTPEQVHVEHFNLRFAGKAACARN